MTVSGGLSRPSFERSLSCRYATLKVSCERVCPFGIQVVGLYAKRYGASAQLEFETYAGRGRVRSRRRVAGVPSYVTWLIMRWGHVRTGTA